jgi:hypothetical protein
MLTWMAVFACGGVLLGALDYARGMRRIVRLPDVRPADSPGTPVSIVVAARNEAATIEPALRSLLALDYAPLEVIVVDDRSDDATAEIAARVLAACSGPAQGRLLRVTDLPTGWLGKNHALQHGAVHAAGELLLFADADVMLEPSVLRRAVAHLERTGADHVAVLPQLRMRGPLLRAFAVSFTVFGSLASRPWQARDPRSWHHIGVGAFNLLHTAAYRAIGMHEAIALRPDDDLKLGKLVKRHGFRQDFALAGELVWLEWYPTVRATVRGLTKNTFSVIDYSVPLLLLATGATVFFWLLPIVALLAGPAEARIAGAVAVASTLALHAHAARLQRIAPAHGLAYPFTVALLVLIMWRSAVLALVRGGIEWRGTHYPLSALRRNRI